jgi:magnesium-transporting ATPase (P-type)
MKNGSDLRMRQAVPAVSEAKSLSMTPKQTKLELNGKSAPRISTATQLEMFFTLILSVIASRFLDYYRGAVSWNPLRDWQYLFFAVIVSLVAFLVVYRKAQRNRSEPTLVQLAFVFTAGIGWEKMLSTATDLFKPH